MANNNPQTEAANNQVETTTDNGSAAANMSAPRRSPNGESRKPSTTPTANPPPLRKQSSNNFVPIASPSPASSPRTSRNASPTRKDGRPQPLSTPISTQPSAAAIQRALSAANVPSLQAGPVPDGVSKLPRAPRSAGASEDNTPHWPTSPRLKSPPPSGTNSRRGSATAQKKPDAAAPPSISVQSATPQASTPQTSTPPQVKQGSDEIPKVPQLQTPVKGPSRGASGKSTLETVQENSTDDKDPSPAAIQAAADLKPLTKISDDDSPSKQEGAGVDTDRQTQQAESGSESAGTKSEKKKEERLQAQRPKTTQIKSYTPLASTKSRQQEGKQNMTVETETVPSVPQSALNAGDRSAGRTENGGSVKLKPSSETIRPKKERKRPTQKVRSINQGTSTFSALKSPLLTQQIYFEESNEDSGAGSSRSSSTVRETSSNDADSLRPKRHISYSKHLQRTLSLRRPTEYIRSLSNKYLRKASSKADIFEARVANAVDEANSSDSDETFVYESNPPETQRRARHHSRTPSVTSAHSALDQQRSGMRNFGDPPDDRKVAGKRSMKFSNNLYNEIDSPESKDGSVRSHQPRHFGRLDRGGGVDQDSPFTQASKLRTNQLSIRRSRPNSPRSPPNGQQKPRSSNLFGKKQEPPYDFDADGGDDERTPLFGSVRTPRSTRLSRRIRSSDSIDEYYGVRRHSRCGRFGGCLLGFIVLVAVILSAVAFLVMSNRPMYEVEVHEVQNVLASEQEIMLDLLVGAVNPNALGIDVTDMDVNIFAKSKHVGTGQLWKEGQATQLTALGVTPKSKRRRKGVSRQRSVGMPKPWQDLSDHWHAPSGGVDRGIDPDDDYGRDPQTMLLGRILEFDQPLTFEGSPLKRHVHESVGELRLEKPGNKTETGGSERWEKVLQFPFELIIRGVLKYQLPISSRLEKARVSASVIVHPEDGVDEFGNMRVEKVDHSEEWQWIDWNDVEEVAGDGTTGVVRVV